MENIMIPLRILKRFHFEMITILILIILIFFRK